MRPSAAAATRRASRGALRCSCRSMRAEASRASCRRSPPRPRSAAASAPMHGAQVAALSTAVAVELGLPAATVELARLGGWLHDCGKVTVPTDILAHRGPLDEKSRARVRHHAIAGEALVSVVPGLERRGPGRAQPSRALRRRGLPRRPGRRRDPARSAHRGRRGRLRGHDREPPLRGPARSSRGASPSCSAAPGSQFDPRIVEALVTVLEHERRGRRGARKLERVREHLVPAYPARMGDVEHSFEPTLRRVRVRFGGADIADTRRALLMMGGYKPPLYELSNYYFPREDVRSDLLVPTAITARTAPTRGEATHWTVARRRARGAWTTPGATRARRPAGRDPRLRRLQLERHGRLVRGGRGGLRPPARPASPRRRPAQLAPHPRAASTASCVADSARPCVLFETGMPDALLPPARRRAHGRPERHGDPHAVPVQGHRRLLRGHVGGQRHDDIAWTYVMPVPECPKIEQLVCFFNEKVETEVDGVVEPPPATKWTTGHPRPRPGLTARRPACERMNETEIRAFLTFGTRTGKLAVTRLDGSPMVVPIWFAVDDDDTLLFTTWSETIKGKSLRRDGARVAVRGRGPAAVRLRAGRRHDDARSMTRSCCARWASASAGATWATQRAERVRRAQWRARGAARPHHADQDRRPGRHRGLSVRTSRTPSAHAAAARGLRPGSEARASGRRARRRRSAPRASRCRRGRRGGA